MKKPNFDEFNTLTFDVVGTLIDFESGILAWFMPMLKAKNAKKSEEEVLTAFAICEDRYQNETPGPIMSSCPLIMQIR